VDGLEAKRVLEGADEPLLAAINLQSVGIAYRRMGELAQAEEYLRQSLANPELSRRWVYRFLGHLHLGFLLGEAGRADAARAALAEAIAICTANAGAVDCGYARLALASVEANAGQPDAALAALAASTRDFQAAGNEGDAAMADLVRGQALAQLGRPAEALRHLDAAVAVWDREHNERYLAMALPVRADVLQTLGEHLRTVADLRRYIEIHARADAKRAAQRTELMREQFNASQRELENAELKAREALREQEIAGLTTTRRWQWTAMALAGVLLLGLMAVVLRQLAKARRLRLLAMTDPLTGLANRRHVEFRGQEVFKQARASGQPFCVLAVDIDHFKDVNDSHGHAIGDQVLQHVARECQRTLRTFDLMGRIGGEEFTGLLPNTALAAAELVAERLRAGIKAMALDAVVPGLRVTVSLGVAQMRPSDADFAALMARADAAMYRAKQSGRDRVVADGDG
jgi:diguanylate cyclase (GGDEF)-like protein